MPGDPDGKWEHIEVIARFAGGRISPLRFCLGGTMYKISRVNYAWNERQGKSLVYFFSVSDGSDSYRLCFDIETMSWRLSPLQ